MGRRVIVVGSSTKHSGTRLSAAPTATLVHPKILDICLKVDHSSLNPHDRTGLELQLAESRRHPLLVAFALNPALQHT